MSADGNISRTTTVGLTNVPDFIVKAKQIDEANQDSEIQYYYFSEASTYFNYYFHLPQVKSAINALATWAVGRGYVIEDPMMKAQIDHVSGVGNDSFESVVYNHLVVKLVVGDSFLEVKRGKTNIILNMIPVSPERVRIAHKSGRIDHYEVWNNKDWKTVKSENMIHSSNKRITDQIHGTPQIEANKDIIDAMNEAIEDERVIKHRDKALGIVYYKTSKSGKIEYANQQIQKAVKEGDMVGMPEDVAKIEPYPSRSSEDRTGWIQFLENHNYQTIGVPRSIVSSDGTSEVGGKMGHVIFEPIYVKEQTDLEADFWNQQAIAIKFNRPPSLGGLQPELNDAKNTGQIGIQPNDVAATTERE